MSPSPTEEHQWELAELYDHVKAFVRQHRLGVVLFAPLDVIIRKTPKLQTRQPDLLFYSWTRLGPERRKALRHALLNGPGPDLAVEILSPEERGRYLERKLEDYVSIDVLEVWLLEPEKVTVEVLRLANGRYERVGLYGKGEALASPVLPGFTLAVDLIFAEE
jgi:Uma2 family endonuclease